MADTTSEKPTRGTDKPTEARSGKHRRLEKLMRIHVALNSCLKEPMAGKLATRGYGPDRINALLDIYADIGNLEMAGVDARRILGETTESIKALSAACKTNYWKFRKLAKVSLANDPAYARALGLTTKMPGSFAAFIALAKRLYTPITSDTQLQTLLAETSGITVEEISGEYALIDTLEHAILQKQLAQKNAKQATKKCRTRMQELETAFSALHRIAQVVLVEHKQFLELMMVNRRIAKRL
ncbi:MAG: hypothetical protein GY765_13425 [bacterium]|nr:hypothetical protein [bacterium]